MIRQGEICGDYVPEVQRQPLGARFQKVWAASAISLVGDGLGMHVPKGYIYFAMGFSVFVELINLRVRKPATPPVKLHSKL